MSGISVSSFSDTAARADFSSAASVLFGAERDAEIVLSVVPLFSSRSFMPRKEWSVSSPSPLSPSDEKQPMIPNASAFLRSSEGRGSGVYKIILFAARPIPLLINCESVFQWRG